jgi:hypothetical protein
VGPKDKPCNLDIWFFYKVWSTIDFKYLLNSGCVEIKKSLEK